MQALFLSAWGYDMSIKAFIREHCPSSLYFSLGKMYRRMKMPAITKRAMKYLPYYQDELSREILVGRLKYLKTSDKNVFIDLAEKIGVKYHKLVDFPEGEFSGIVIVYDNESSDFRYTQRLMPLSDWSGRYRFMKLNDFLRGSEIKDDELLTCILTAGNRKKFDKYISRNNLHYSFKKGLLYSINSDEQYFDVFAPNDDEIVVDAGSYDGMTALHFLEWGGSKIKRIYSFELDPANFPKCEAHLKGHEDKVTLIPKGTWSKNKTVYITSDDYGTTLAQNGTIPAELTVIDDVVGDEKVTFIKMDVEGAELESLKGAKNTIIKNHPRLAICAYHKPEDLYELPGYILSLVPEYKFYLRHYYSCQLETVLYGFVD